MALKYNAGTLVLQFHLRLACVIIANMSKSVCACVLNP